MPAGNRGSGSSASQRNVAALMGALCLLLMLIVAALEWRYVQFERSLLASIEASNQRYRAASEYLSLLQDMETGQRGFVLTGNPEFLEPFQNAQSRLPEAQSKLADLFGDQSASVSALLQLGQSKARYSRTVVSAHRERGSAEAARLIGSGLGKRLMDQARREVTEIEQAEQRLKEALSSEAARKRRDQQRFILLAEAALLAAALALVVALLGKVRALDRSARSLSDAATRQSAIFENASDAMLMLDRTGEIVSLNAAAERLFGRNRDNLVGRSNLTLFADPPSIDDSRAYLERLALEDGSAEPTQTFIGRRGDGTHFEIEVVTTPVQLHDGLYFLAVGRDVTERRRVERMKSEFVATVSHELRTPLTSISGSLGLLAGGSAGPLPDKARRLIDIALNNSQRLIRLINDMLDLEKIESGKMVFESRPIPLAPFLEQVAASNAGFAEKHGVEVRLETVPGEAEVVADHDRTVQVLTNLLSNAVKHSPVSGTVSIRVTQLPSQWRISVADQGRGIPEEFRGRIFDKFAQADGTDARLLGGSGLGLSIVREIVTRSGGSIEYETQAGKGTTFHLDLPAVNAAATCAERQSAGIKAFDDGRKHILHIEDDVDTLRVISAAFEKVAEVHSTPSVLEATASLQRHRFDAIVLDLVMEDGDGLALLPLIRETSPGAPVVLFTAMDAPQGAVDLVDAVVTKSRGEIGELVQLVSDLMSAKPTNEGRAAA